MQQNYKYNQENNKETNFISTLMFRFVPYWPLFIVLLLVGLVGAWAYLQYATPMYEIHATILLRDEKKGVDESDILEALDIPAGKKIVENELEVVHSRKIMKEVINQLHLYAPVFENGSVKATSAYVTSPVSIQAKNPDKLRLSENISFSVKGDKAVEIDNQTYAMNEWVTTPYGELRFVPNPKRTKKSSDPLFFQLYNPENLASTLLIDLDVEPASKLSTVVNLSYKDEVPQRGEDILNKLIETYNRLSVDDKSRLATNTLAFIETRLGGVEKELDSLDRSIENYRTKKGVVNLSEQGKLFLQNVGTNDRKVADLSMQLAVLDQVEQYVISKDRNSGIVPSTLGLEAPVLSSLLEKLYDAELEYEKLRRTTGAQNPMVATVAKEVEQIRPHILETVRNQRLTLQASRNDLNATSGMYNAMLLSIPQKERELTEISRQRTIKNNVYDFLLEKREQTALAISLTSEDSKVVDVARSSAEPVSPKRIFVYLGALVIALGLGIGLISAKELLNRKILFRSEIESFTSVPVMAEISYTKEKDTLLNTGSKISFAAEQFRQLRAAIGLYGQSNDNTKRLLVTSSISGEGKSYISTNLAISLASAGKKVVLVDLDIRNPKTSMLLGMEGEAGVAEFLGGLKQPEEIIRKTNCNGLYIIGAGGEVDNSRELILSGKLNELLSHLDANFDYIVLDTSPVDPVTDAYVFSEYCDTTLFVVRHRYTPKTTVQMFDNNNKIKALKNPCIVFNDIRPRGLFKGNYGYGYGYGYQNVYREKSRRVTKVVLEA